MEKIKLNLIPSGVNPTCYCSQYDNGRVIRVELFDGLTPYTLQAGDVVTLNVRKPDNHIVTTTVTTTQGNNYVDIVTTEQITACVGFNLCDLTITNGSTVIGTLNFIMAIERDVLADGVPSESVIEDLDALVAEAVGDNYYNKQETDALLDAKANANSVYTKTETDEALALKADSADVDAALALKADKTEVYNVYPTDEASGSLANFTDGAENIPVKSLTAQILATQEGTGDPSPSNVRPITGASSLSVTRSGKNLMPSLFEGTRTANGITYTVNEDGTVNISGNVGTYSNSIQNYGHILLPAGTYTLSGNPDNVSTSQRDTAMVLCKNAYSGSVNVIVSLYSNSTQPKATFTLTEPTDCYLRLYCYPIAGTYPANTTFKPMIEAGSSSSEFEPCNQDTKTIDLGQTVYGGSLNVTTGVLTISSVKEVLKWSEGGAVTTLGTYTRKMFTATIVADETGAQLCNVAPYLYNYSSDSLHFYCRAYTEETRIYLFLNESTLPAGFDTFEVVYKMANPITAQLTPAEVKTLLGVNNIFSNSGEVDVIYRADIGLYIDKKLSQLAPALGSNLLMSSANNSPIENTSDTPTDNEER